MNATIDSMLDHHKDPPPTIPTSSNLQIQKWVQRLTLIGGLACLAASFLVRHESMRILSIAFGLLAGSAFLEFGFRWRALQRAAARQDWRRYGLLHEVIQRLEDGLDVVSPVIPTIELEGQTLVVLRAWSMESGKAILLLDRNGRAIRDQDVWRKSIMLIEFANACLPGAARNRRAMINTNLHARNQATRAWKRALSDNKDTFSQLGLAAEHQCLLEHWEQLASFLSLRIALFQAEETVSDQVAVPSDDQEEIEAWLETQRRIHLEMETLTSCAEKIAATSAHLLTGWLNNKTSMGWTHPNELQAGLKFAYLFQSLLLRTLHRWDGLANPDLTTFQRGLELARETGLMTTLPA